MRFRFALPICLSLLAVRAMAVQITAVQIFPVAGIVGQTSPVSAKLTESPSGAAIAGQTITFTFSDPLIGPLTAITGANGTATASVIANAASAGTVTASFSDPTNFFGSSAATTTFSFTKALTSLTGFVPSPPTFLVGTPFTLSGTLTRSTPPAGPIADAPVTFTLSGAAPTQTFTRTTDATGAVSGTITIPQAGNYVLTIQYAGTDLLQQATRILTFPALTPTAIAMNAVQGTAGVPVSVTAEVSSLGSPLAGQTVTFAFPNLGAPKTAITNAAGVATVQMTFPSAGTFSILASIPANIPAFVQSALTTATATIERAVSALTPISGPTHVAVGAPASFQTTFTRSGVAAGNTGVRFVVTRPLGLPPIDVTVPTAANGVATYTLSSVQPQGNYTVTASVSETPSQTAASTAPHALSATVATTLTLSADTVTFGSATTFTATLKSTSGSTPIGNQIIALDFGGTAVTNSLGVATITHVLPSAGSHIVTASFSNPSAFLDGSSASTTAIVTAAATSLAINAPSSVESGTAVDVAATLTSNGVPVAGATISFGTSTAQTDGDGVARATVIAGCSSATVNASFAGSNNYFPSSASQAIWVVDTTGPIVTASLAGGVVGFGATDNCTLASATAMMTFPSTEGFEVTVKKNEKKQTLAIDYKKRKITVSGVPPYEQFLAAGGVAVTNGQSLEIDTTKKDVVTLEFNNGVLTSVSGNSPTLTVTATDAAGNTSTATAQ